MNPEEQQIEHLSFDQLDRKVGFYVTHFVPGTLAETASNYTAFFVPEYPLQIIAVRLRYTNPGSGGSGAALQLTRTRPGSTVNILASAFDLTQTANTTYTKRGRSLQNTTVLPDDFLAISGSGTLTNVQNISLTIYCKPKGRGDYA